jgi:hypothetical protein
MNMLLLAIILILLVICVILIILLIRRNTQEVVENNSSTNLPEKNIDIIDIQIPKKIEEMGHHLLFQSCLKVFESFKALDYASKSEKILDNIEWHSWQISLLIALLQSDKDFFIPSMKKVFHPSILNRSSSTIENDMQKILKKYEDNVNILKSRDDLSKDIIWSCKEVSIIFYYMVIIKNI